MRLQELTRECSINSVHTSKLMRVLHELKVVPFIPRKVDEYKEKALDDYRWRIDFNKKVEFWAQVAIVITIVFGILATGASPLLFGAAMRENMTFKTAFGIQTTGSVLAVLFAVVTAAFGIVFNSFKYPHWRYSKYEEFCGNVPSFVRQTVSEIKERMKDVPYIEFHIDALCFNDKPSPDPFLVVASGSTYERYYIEVWNDEFNKERGV